jgi:hypothetical protein
MDGAAFELARLGGHRGLFFVARTMGARCWEPFRLGRLIQRGNSK